MTDSLVRISATDLDTDTDAGKAAYFRYLIDQAESDGAWEVWLTLMFGSHFGSGFAPHHEILWEWLWGLTPGVKPDPMVCGWPRGGGKSASAEAGVAMLGCRGLRRFVLYISGTQAKADRHVESIAGLLESRTVALAYPHMGEPKVSSVTGLRRSWKRQRLTTQSGFTVEGLGLDVGIRGAKLDETRPDGEVLDDLDDEDDTLATVEAKIEKLTTAILPAGTADLAVLGVQNVVHGRSVFARLLALRGDEPWLDPDTDPADFLANRIVSGPVPAVEGLEVSQRTDDEGRHRFEITEGRATWVGQPLETCQAQIDEWGFTAFEREAQHSTAARAGGMFDHLTFAHVAWDEGLRAKLARVVVACDPAVSNTDRSDSHGVQVGAIDGEGVVYFVRSWERRASPEEAIRKALTWGHELGADRIVIESDQGGMAWSSVFDQAWEELIRDDGFPQITGTTNRPRYYPVKAGSSNQSKEGRAQELLADMERPGRVVLVEGSEQLEAALHRFPRTKPFDLVDAAVWAWRDLRGRTTDAAVVGTAQGQTFGRSWGPARRGLT